MKKFTDDDYETVILAIGFIAVCCLMYLKYA